MIILYHPCQHLTAKVHQMNQKYYKYDDGMRVCFFFYKLTAKYKRELKKMTSDKNSTKEHNGNKKVRRD